VAEGKSAGATKEEGEGKVGTPVTYYNPSEEMHTAHLARVHKQRECTEMQWRSTGRVVEK